MDTEKVNLLSLLSCNLKSISHLLKWTGFLQHPTNGSLQVPRIWEHLPSCHKPLVLPFLTPTLLSTLSLGSMKLILFFFLGSMKMILKGSTIDWTLPQGRQILVNISPKPNWKRKPSLFVESTGWFLLWYAWLLAGSGREIMDFWNHSWLSEQPWEFFFSIRTLSSHPHLAPSFRHLRLIETLLPSLGNLPVWEQAWPGHSQSAEWSAGLSGLIDG